MDPMDLNVKVRIVTPEQLKLGWAEFRPNEIPNVVYHRYEVIGQNRNGDWVVKEPWVSPRRGGG